MPNDTRCQHFVCQSEQKQNAIPDDPSHIYGFRILDRERDTISPGRSKPISQNLMYNNLYTIADLNGQSGNFEGLFHRYETTYEDDVEKLLESGDKGALTRILKLKWLDDFRTPYNCGRTINTISPILDSLRRRYRRIRELDKEIQTMQKRFFGNKKSGVIEAKAYDELWKILWVLLNHKLTSGLWVLDHIIEKMILETRYTIVTVFKYTGHSPVLCDRSHISIVDTGEISLDLFNLNSRAFLQTGSYSREYLGKHTQSRGLGRLVDSFINSITINIVTDRMHELERYNIQCAYQAFEHVYCSVEHPYGLKIQP